MHQLWSYSNVLDFPHKIVGGKLLRLLTWDIFSVKKNIEIKYVFLVLLKKKLN